MGAQNVVSLAERRIRTDAQWLHERQRADAFFIPACALLIATSKRDPEAVEANLRKLRAVAEKEFGLSRGPA